LVKGRIIRIIIGNGYGFAFHKSQPMVPNKNHGDEISFKKLNPNSIFKIV